MNREKCDFEDKNEEVFEFCEIWLIFLIKKYKILFKVNKKFRK